MAGEETRRQFLIRAAAALAVPATLASCGRGGRASDNVKPPASSDADIEEAPGSALIRPPVPTIEPVIRVCVMRLRGGPGSLLTIGEENQWLGMRGVRDASEALALYGPLTIALEPEGWSIIDGKDFRVAVAGRETLEIAAMDQSQPPLIRVVESGMDAPSMISMRVASPKEPPRPRIYPGTLRLVARPDLAPATPEAFDLINDVPLEAYLPGVLAGELYSSWDLETFASQAVAARSFASTEIAVFAGRRHFDVTNTASSQMYLGSVADSRAHQAVQITRGVVLSYQNLLVSGYYSSCCGGLAASAADAIGDNAVNNIAPLHGRTGPDACIHSPHYQWKLQQPVELLTRRLIAYGQERRIKDLANFTRVQSIEATAWNASGRPTRMRITDAQQDGALWAELTAENFRRAANHSGQGLNPPDKPLKSSNLRAAFDGKAVTFEGFGFGHGVGLCQYGAEALAKRGMPHREIVQWYYPGAELVQAYG